MRYASYVITPHDGYFDPGEVVFRRHGITLRSIQHIDVLRDGSMVMLYSIDGDRDAVDASFDNAGSKVIDYSVAGSGDALMLQVHYHPSDSIATLFDLHRSYATHFDYPLEFVDPETSSLRVSIIGLEEDIQEQMSATRRDVDVRIERIGSYEPATSRLFTELTERQREVLVTAVEHGYYDSPRQVTYEDLAAELDCSAGAVGQHLRRIEATLVAGVVPARERGGS